MGSPTWLGQAHWVCQSWTGKLLQKAASHPRPGGAEPGRPQTLSELAVALALTGPLSQSLVQGQAPGDAWDLVGRLFSQICSLCHWLDHSMGRQPGPGWQGGQGIWLTPLENGPQHQTQSVSHSDPVLQVQPPCHQQELGEAGSGSLSQSLWGQGAAPEVVRHQCFPILGSLQSLGGHCLSKQGGWILGCHPGSFPHHPLCHGPSELEWCLNQHSPAGHGTWSGGETTVSPLESRKENK